MGRFLSDDQVRKVKETADLVEVMGDYAPPQRAGAQFRVCCPFHQERTPSCYIYPDQQTYHCFGCGAHGDIITLVREKEGLDFVDAVEFLARRYAIELHFEERGRPAMARSERERLLAAINFAADYYQKCLWEGDAAAARNYLSARGISEEQARAFRLGWAPGRGALLSAGRRAGHSAEDFLKVDCAVDRDGRYNDRFYERISFPICDRFGQVIAFSARILPEAEKRAKEAGRGVGKYINSTDTPLYHKSSVVFNLHQARSAVREEKRLLVMEGPTDVMAAWAAGIKACVAVLGTAMTADHARQLGNVLGGSGRLVLLFDGDDAGRRNSLKAVRTCLGAGVACRVAIVPDGKDPADFLKEGGRQGLERVIADHRTDIDHLLVGEAPTPHAMEPRERLQAIDRLLEALRPVEDLDLRRAYLEEVGMWFRIDVERLERRLGGGTGVPLEQQAPRHEEEAVDAVVDGVLHLLVKEPQLRDQAFDTWQLEPALIPPPWRQLVEIILLEPEIDRDGLLLHERIQGDALLTAAVHRWIRSEKGVAGADFSNPEQVLQDSIQRLRQMHFGSKEEALQAQLAQAQAAGDNATAGRLFMELMQLQRQRREQPGH